MKRFPKGSYSAKALGYAKDILSGKIPACLQVRQACQRFIDDFERTDIVFDTARVDHVCSFAEQLPHVIGPLTGENITLEPFQIFVFANLFGWLNVETRLRRFREALLLLPRGNAKSTIAAIIGLYMAFCEGQGGAEGLAGATSMAQADAVFVPAKRMVEMSPDFARQLGVETMARSIYQVSTGSSFRPVIAKTKDGGLPWIAIADEVHQAQDGTQLAAFRTGMGKRRGADPLLLIVSTAGTNTAGVCRTEQLYFESVLAKTVVDDSKFALIYTIDKEDDWRDFSVWRKANPNYGVSVDEDHLRREHAKALQSPSSQAEALTKYLNVWVSGKTGWLDQAVWAKAAVPDLRSRIIAGASIWVGVDLSTKTDITAVTFVTKLADGKTAMIPKLFLPEGALARSKNAKAYEEWIATGALTKSLGEASDHSEVENYIRELGQKYRIEACMFDIWQGAGMSQRLAADGLRIEEFPQRASTLMPVMTDFESELLNGRILHDDNPVMNWMANNVSVQQRGPFRSLGKPDGQDHLKIDGIMTALMAFGQSRKEDAIVAPPQLFFI